MQTLIAGLAGRQVKAVVAELEDGSLFGFEVPTETVRQPKPPTTPVKQRANSTKPKSKELRKPITQCEGRGFYETVKGMATVAIIAHGIRGGRPWFKLAFLNGTEAYHEDGGFFAKNSKLHNILWF